MNSSEDNKNNSEARRTSLDERRKSLGLLRELTDKWESRESPEKYKRSDREDTTVALDVKESPQKNDVTIKTDEATSSVKIDDSVDTRPTGFDSEVDESAMEDILLTPLPPPRIKMSSMEEESQRERLRLNLLREMAQILDSETRYTKETFRRTFLNKVRETMYVSPYSYSPWS